MNSETIEPNIFAILVLIDTWWNVNVDVNGIVASVSLVLIDTWWNVNYEWDERGLELVKVLIDTWWNVNFCRICRSGHVP